MKEKNNSMRTSSEDSRYGVSSSEVEDPDSRILDQFDTLVPPLKYEDEELPTVTERRGQGWLRPSFIVPAITFAIIIIVLVVLTVQLDHTVTIQFPNATDSVIDSEMTCSDNCRINLVESNPVGLVFPNDTILQPSLYHSWMKLISSAQSSIDIATYYLRLRRDEANYTGDGPRQGEDVFEELLKAGRDRGVRLRVIRGVRKLWNPEADSEYLTREARAQVRTLDLTNISGTGFMHTKLWVIDRRHFYLGSNNADWQALTQLKELGLLAVNCSCLAKDAAKIFDMYWKLYEDGIIPPNKWKQV